MAANTKNTNTQETTTKSPEPEFEADVLFQRMFGKWYAFSVHDDECLVTEVSENEVNKRLGGRGNKIAA